MQSVKNQIKEFFNFNKGQERGAFVLVVLIILAFAFNFFLPKLLKEKNYDFTSTLEEIDAWEKSAIEISSAKLSSSNTNYSETIKDEAILLSPFLFNPNKLPREKWLEMGVPESVVNTILKYEAKGGSFKKEEDIQKIYGLTDEIYSQLKDFIKIPTTQSPKELTTNPLDSQNEETRIAIILDINRADSASLLKVPGIGPFYAGQIVNYRSRLGGYKSMEQLNELYKMDSSRLNTFLPYLTLKDTIINQLNINTSDFKTVLKHPYLDYETTKKIFNLRNKLGRFAGLYQLKKDSILSDSLFLKLEPYLKVE